VSSRDTDPARTGGANPAPPVAQLLGRAGLVPFCAAPLAIWLWPAAAERIGDAFAVYSLGIVCFLLGAWWGIGLIRRSAAGLLLSNALFLAAVAGFLTLPLSLALLFNALLLAITVVVERHHALFRPAPAYYRALRLQLTAVAGTALAVSAWLLA
jgi:hypothetical protein